MIKKAYLVAVLIVLSAIVTIVALGANDSKTDIQEQSIVYATTKDTNTSSLVSTEEVTESETDTVSTEATNDEKVDTVSTENSQPDSIAEDKSYTDDDLFYLAAAVCREAGGSSEEIQLLVANVVINRVNSSLYPDTIYDVLTDYRQYGMMWKYGVSFPDWAKNEANQKTITQCYSVAKRVLDGERFCPDNVLFQAEFKQGSGVYKHFEGFYFCYYE